MNRFRSLGLAIAVLAVVAGLAPLGSATGATPRPARVLRLPALHAEPDPVAGGRIVDAEGRQVLLRGVNVDALAEYWQHGDQPPPSRSPQRMPT